MDKIERIEQYVKSNREWHSRRIQFYAEEGEIAKSIVKALEGMEYELEMGSGIELKFKTEEEARLARGMVTITVESIEKWEKTFNAFDTYKDEPEWRWEAKAKIDDMDLWIRIYPTTPKPGCVPRLQENESYRSKSWICEGGEGE